MTTVAPPDERAVAGDYLIQADHPDVRALARSISAGGDADERAVRIFGWVRDEIAYCVESDRSALEVLQDRRGVCVTKAVAHVALLRAAGLPSRLGHADYQTSVLARMFPEAYLARQPDVYPMHTFAEVYLDGQWLTCDATIDAGFGWDMGFPVNTFDGQHATDTMVGMANEVRRYCSYTGTELMNRYEQALTELGIPHEQLRREFQILDTYIDTVRARRRLQRMEQQLTAQLRADPGQGRGAEQPQVAPLSGQ